MINMNIPQAVALKKKAVGIIYYGDILSVSFPMTGARHNPRITLIIITLAYMFLASSLSATSRGMNEQINRSQKVLKRML